MVFGGGTAPGTTLRARSGPLAPPCTWDLANAASGPIRAELRSFYYKVSQNDEVSPKKCQKAYHSPCSQNGLKKSPLEKLRFPVSPAFSHKELMVPKDAWVDIYGQNDEVSTECTPKCHAKGSSRYPHRPRSKLLLGSAPHLASARYSQRHGSERFCT